MLDIPCVSRILLTGTERGSLDLPTLAHFLLPLTGKTSAARDKHISKLGDELEETLSPLFLRRLQKNIVSKVCTKWDKTDVVELEPKQRKLYDALVSTHKQAEGQQATVGLKERERVFKELRKAANHPMLLRQNSYTPEIIEKVVDFAFAQDVYGSQARREQVFDEVNSLSDIQLHVLCSEFEELNKYAIPRRTICGESAKLRRLRQLLPSLRREGHRMLVYSQWSDMLDILEELCLELNMDYQRLDGRTPVAERQQLIDDFNDDDAMPIFLLSTRIGVGINLTGADTVIFHDVDVNPQNDHQAESRCYRIGQTRTVTVYKMFAEDTVDAKIADIAARIETRQQIRSSEMELDGASAASSSAESDEQVRAHVPRLLEQLHLTRRPLVAQVVWKDVVAEALDGLGLFKGEA